MPAATLTKVVAYVRRLTDAGTRGLTDRQLLDRFTREREEAAFAELVRRHGPMVLAVCRRVLRHEQDAEDAFQASFLVLARKAGSIRQHDGVGGWLYQVAHRLAVRAKSLGARRGAMVAPLGSEPAAPAPDSGPNSLQTALDEELALLPEAYRSAIVLCYLEGKTQSEAARMLAITTDAVNSRLKRARDLLRHRLARHGLVLSGTAVTNAFAAGAAQAVLSPSLVAHTARVALHFMTHQAQTAGASAVALVLAKGALQNMIPVKIKILSLVALVLALLTSGAFLLPSNAQEDPALAALKDKPVQSLIISSEEPDPKDKKPRRCIILWMSGGPSQIDTFDPKGGNVALFKAIDTNVKGVQFSETLPLLAKQANHLAVLRAVSHRDGDHGRGSVWMRTGFAPGETAFPSLGCVLGKELAGDATKLPRYVSIDPMWKPPTSGFGPGILGEKYGPLNVGGIWFGAPRIGPAADFASPSVEEFEKLDKENGAAMHKAIAKAFDLAAEKAELRDAYGRGRFGNGCLLARRLIETGVPVVEVSLGGWDTHANAVEVTTKVCAQLDAGMATLVKDLHQKKLLDSTLIVWMGEFGRTPRINKSGGRDHWPMHFSAVLAGAAIKGGQAIGKTSADALQIDERDVTPQELLATIYEAVGVNANKVIRTPDGQKIPLVEKGTKAVKEALR
jgi:RNA polymerase sigma factor (sigma-70 family)